jgi:hypothetical protein
MCRARKNVWGGHSGATGAAITEDVASKQDALGEAADNLPLNFHRAASGARFVFTPMVAG